MTINCVLVVILVGCVAKLLDYKFDYNPYCVIKVVIIVAYASDEGGCSGYVEFYYSILRLWILFKSIPTFLLGFFFDSRYSNFVNIGFRQIDHYKLSTVLICYDCRCHCAAEWI